MMSPVSQPARVRLRKGANRRRQESQHSDNEVSRTQHNLLLSVIQTEHMQTEHVHVEDDER